MTAPTPTGAPASASDAAKTPGQPPFRDALATLALIRDFAASKALVRNDALDHIQSVASAALKHAALAPPVVPESVRRLESGDEAVFSCACARWVRTILSAPSQAETAGGDGWIKGPPPSEPDFYGHLPDAADAADDGLGAVLWMLWWEATETGSRIAWHRKPIAGPEPTPANAGAEGGLA